MALNNRSKSKGELLGKAMLFAFIGLVACQVLWSNSLPVQIFDSKEERLKYFSSLGVPTNRPYPIVLSADWCPACSALRANLDAAGIQYYLGDIEKNRAAAALFEKVASASGSRGIPKVIIGDQLVPGYVEAIAARLRASPDQK